MPLHNIVSSDATRSVAFALANDKLAVLSTANGSKRLQFVADGTFVMRKVDGEILIKVAYDSASTRYLSFPRRSGLGLLLEQSVLPLVKAYLEMNPLLDKFLDGEGTDELPCGYGHRRGISNRTLRNIHSLQRIAPVPTGTILHRDVGSIHPVPGGVLILSTAHIEGDLSNGRLSSTHRPVVLYNSVNRTWGCLPANDLGVRQPLGQWDALLIPPIGQFSDTAITNSSYLEKLYTGDTGCLEKSHATFTMETGAGFFGRLSRLLCTDDITVYIGASACTTHVAICLPDNELLACFPFPATIDDKLLVDIVMPTGEVIYEIEVGKDGVSCTADTDCFTLPYEDGEVVIKLLDLS